MPSQVQAKTYNFISDYYLPRENVSCLSTTDKWKMETVPFTVKMDDTYFSL